MQENNSLQNKRMPIGKITASAFFGLVSILLFVFYYIEGVGVIDLMLNAQDWEGLALIIVVPLMFLLFGLVNLSDIIWLIISAVLFKSVKNTASKTKIYALASIIISGAVLVLSWALLIALFVENNIANK